MALLLPYRTSLGMGVFVSVCVVTMSERQIVRSKYIDLMRGDRKENARKSNGIEIEGDTER